MNKLFLILVSCFLAFNMGSSGFSVSFTPSVGSEIVKKEKAVILFTIFVLLGSLFAGVNVVKTISSKIVPSKILTEDIVLIIFLSSSISLLIANILKIPQSTSLITIGSFTGIGLYFKNLNLFFLIKILIVWILISFLIYLSTYFIWRKIYPPSFKNIKIYEKIFLNKERVKKFTFLTDLYKSFGIGSNNVANVVGPLYAAKIISPYEGFLIYSLLFGIGAYVLGRKVITTVSKDIIYLGFASSSVVSLVVSTIIILCSISGLPAPYVQFSTVSILAIHTLKEEKKHIETFNHPLSKKIIKIWILTPILSWFISWLLLYLFKND